MSNLAFEVVLKQEGRSGTITYKEQDGELPFFWEYILDGIGVSVPTVEEWDAYCEKHNADWARDRRDELLQKVAQSLAKRQRNGTSEIADHWLNIHRGPSLLTRLFSRFT